MLSTKLQFWPSPNFQLIYTLNLYSPLTCIMKETYFFPMSLNIFSLANPNILI